MAASDPSDSGNSPFAGAGGGFAYGFADGFYSQDSMPASRLPAGMQPADDSVPEQEATRRAELPEGFLRAAGPVLRGDRDATVASGALKESLEDPPMRGASAAQRVAPQLPGFPFQLASTHVQSRASVPLPDILLRVNEALHEQGVDFKFIQEKVKCRCFQYKVGGYCKFILRAFQNEQGTFILEFQRRAGDGARFHELYSQMLRAFAGLTLIEDDQHVVLAERDPPSGPSYTTTVVDEGDPTAAKAQGLPPTPDAKEVPGAAAEEAEEDPSAPLDAEALAAALAPVIEMLKSSYEETKMEATQSVAELASDGANTEAMVNSGVVRLLAVMMASGSESTTTRTLATMALAELAAHPVAQQAIVEVEGLPRAFMDIAQAKATHGGYAMRRAAVLALARLSGYSGFQSKFAEQARQAVREAETAARADGGDVLMVPVAQEALGLL